MSYTTRLMTILVIMLLATIAVGGVYASTVTISGGQISQAGEEISVPVVLDSADNGLIYYQMRITVADPSVAEVTKVEFPAWAGIHAVPTTLPAAVVDVTGGDLHQVANEFINQPGATNVPIATVTLKGLQAGSTPVNLVFVGQALGAVTFYPSVQAGTIQVGGVAPTTTVTTQVTTAVTTQATTEVTTQATTAVTTQATTQPTTTATTQATTAVTTQPTSVVPTGDETTVVTTQPTTVVTTQATTAVPTTEVTTAIPTTVPTTPPYTGPTGQVYLSTTPQGAQIVLDGVPSNAVTPIIMTVPVGDHVVIFKLAGYDEVQANFEAKTNAMATVSRRLSPGSYVVPTTPGTPVVTTVPTTTVTQLTTSPTTEPTTFPTSAGSGVLQIPSWATRFLSIFKFPWG